MRLAILSSMFGIAAAFAATTTSSPATFNKDVLPILQKNCQGCHRPGEAAPMSFLTYKEARPWAKAIKGAVLSKKMPPWLADPHYGQFRNDRKLSEHEIETLVSWADSGAPEGKAKDAPKPIAWVEGWNIGQPDKVFQMPENFDVPASGTVEYQYVVMHSGFEKDTWVQAAEVRPGNRAVVHHVIAFARPPGSKWMADAPFGKAFVPEKGARSRNRTAAANGNAQAQDQGASMLGTEFLAGYAPGLPELKFEPGQARLVPAGSDIVFQLHYTPNGKPAVDKTTVGLVFAKEEPKQRIVTLTATQARFAIPPNDPNYEVKSQFTLQEDSNLVWLMPHMHLRGKDFIYTAVYPTGEKQVLLSVPKYDFSWQLSYDEAQPVVLPKGTRIECVAHFDNSVNNKYNPDPTKEVRWGDQSWEEMMIGWFGVAIDAKADPMKLYVGDKAKKGNAKSSD
jgi:hypothetical protein